MAEGDVGQTWSRIKLLGLPEHMESKDWIAVIGIGVTFIVSCANFLLFCT